MQITILVDSYYPQMSAGAKLIHDLAIEFLRKGHQVAIVTPSEIIFQPLEVETVELGLPFPLHIVRVRTGRIKGACRVWRAIQEYRLSANIWNKAGEFLRAHRSDLLIYYSPSIFFGPLVRRLKALWRCPAYLILRDIFPQWAVDAGVLRKGLAWRFLRHKEREQYLQADTIAVQSPANLEYFTSNFPHLPASVEVLLNWHSAHEPALVATTFRKLWCLENKIVFVYGGNIGVAQDMDNILRLAASLVDRQEIQFVLVGSGSEVKRLNYQIRYSGLQNIRIFPALEQNQYLSMLAEFDVGLLSLDRRLTTHNIPGKLLGYLYSGLPVLASLNAGNDLFELLGGHQAGICVLTGNDAALRSAAVRLADNPQLRRQMGHEGRKLLETRFSAEAAAQQILNRQ